jgi:glycosyltransferase involved in cell wall biosynthesis
MLSVVVPAYNRAALVSRTLSSLLAQTRPAEEILVVDDGSSDGSAAIAESFGSPVRVIRQANQGPAAARNRGLAEAKGEWVHFFDSDDLAMPNLHAEQLRVLEATGADVAYAPWLKCEISAQSIVPITHVLQHHGLPYGNLVRALLTNWSVVPICGLIRTRLARQVGGGTPHGDGALGSRPALILGVGPWVVANAVAVDELTCPVRWRHDVGTPGLGWRGDYP